MKSETPHGIGLAIISPAYYRYIYKYGLPKFIRFAKNVWHVEEKGRREDEIALEGINRLETFIKELGITQTLRDIGATEEMLPLIAQSTAPGGGYKKMNAEDIMVVLRKSF